MKPSSSSIGRIGSTTPHRLSQLMITVWCTALPILRVITYAVADPTHPSTPNSAPTVRRHTGVSTPQYSDSD